MSQQSSSQTNNASEQTFSFTEVAYHLQVKPETLRGWNQQFGRFLRQAGDKRRSSLYQR